MSVKALSAMTRKATNYRSLKSQPSLVIGQTIVSEVELKMYLNHQALKERQRNERAAHPTNLAVRVHRALSWLERAERAEDNDGKFIFLWIAFNAAYAQELTMQEQSSEHSAFGRFLRKLIDLDKEAHLQEMIWTEFAGSIRALLDNPYVYQPLWDAQNGRIDQDDWKRKFDEDKKRVMTAIGKQNAHAVLSVVLSRLYTLRNQLIHGGATLNSQVNRNQVKDGANILGKFVPLVIQLMLDNADTIWGDACYPVIDSPIPGNREAG